MPQSINISPSSGPKPSQSGSKKASREGTDGPLSDRRIQITALVAAAVIVIVLVVFAIGAFGGLGKNLTLQDQIRREKALRDREEAPHDSPTVPGQPDSGQTYTRGAK